jgi:MYXO-CTERM domain-containing protein
MRFEPLSILVVVACVVSTANSAIVVGYDVEPGGDPLAVAESALNIGGLDLSRGSGLSVGGTSTFNSKDFDPNNTSSSSALETGDYLQFGFTVAEGFQVELTDLNLRYDRSGTGPDQLEIRISADGIGSYSTSVFSDSSVSDAGENNTGIGLASLGALTGTVTFRVAPFGASSTAGTFDLENHADIGTDRGIVINGTVSLTPVPEPEEYALAAGLALVGFAVLRRRRQSKATV